MRRGAVLDGYFGMHNAGDDAFCLVAARLLPERLGFDRLAVVAAQNELPILPPLAKGLLPTTPLVRGHVRAATIAGKLRYRTVLHVGGSTLRRMNQRRRDEAGLQKSAHISCHALGVSVGPFRNSTDERQIREFLKRFGSISLRDRASYERADAMSLDLPLLQAFDLAVLAPDRMPSPLPRRPRARPRLGVALRPFESIEGGSVETERVRVLRVMETLMAVAKVIDYELVLLAFNCHPTKGDIELANMVADELEPVVPSSVVSYEGDVPSMLSAVAACDAVLAMRLHAGVFAYASGVPFAFINYHPKCQEFADSVGLPQDFIFASDGSDLICRAETVVDLLTREYPPLLPLESARSMALEAFDLLEARLDN